VTLLPLGVAIAGGLTAAVATVADGALLASVPTVDSPDGEPPSRPAAAGAALDASLPARERAHRALAFLRVTAHGVTGGAVALLLDDRNGPAPARGLALLAAALVTVLLTEGTARALGDVLRETAADRLAPFTRLIERVLWPVVRLGAVLDRLFDRVVAAPVTAEEAREAAAEQFRQVVEAEPSVSHVTRDLLLGVFDFGETTVSEVMVPRVDMIAIDRDAPWREVVDRVRSAHHSRMPVYVDSVDEIVGVLYAKDLLAAVIDDEEPGGDWTTCIRPAQYIPSTKRIADQLRDFRATHTHIAIVADEYGGTEGLVTIEDILEELVGEIRDEYDDEERHIEEEDGVRYWVSGRLTLDDLSDTLGADFHHEEVSTIGGLIYELLGRVPRAGEVLEIAGFRVVVERVVRRKVARVFLERRPPSAVSAAEVA
jgi:CBS domain containing-hemolysin-like protein